MVVHFYLVIPDVVNTKKKKTRRNPQGWVGTRRTQPPGRAVAPALQPSFLRSAASMGERFCCACCACPRPQGQEKLWSGRMHCGSSFLRFFSFVFPVQLPCELGTPGDGARVPLSPCSPSHAADPQRVLTEWKEGPRVAVSSVHCMGPPSRMDLKSLHPGGTRGAAGTTQLLFRASSQPSTSCACLLPAVIPPVQSKELDPRATWEPPGQHHPPLFSVQSASPSPAAHTASSPQSWGERAFLPLSPHSSAPQGSPTSGLPEVRRRSLHSAHQADDTARKFLLQAGPNP